MYMKRIILSTIFVIFAFAVQSQDILQTRIETVIKNGCIFQREVNVSYEDFTEGKTKENLSAIGWNGYEVWSDDNGNYWAVLKIKVGVFARVIGQKQTLIR